ncbi:hypothetical protein C8R44DRAFT_853656 [Mycena epipterygia]|nr:hypothetical protein C8R44DRAFT_853656 [Mycena epipterygia]
MARAARSGDNIARRQRSNEHHISSKRTRVNDSSQSRSGHAVAANSKQQEAVAVAGNKEGDMRWRSSGSETGPSGKCVRDGTEGDEAREEWTDDVSNGRVPASQPRGTLRSVDEG